ncbi:MAG: hypothetical protein ABGZ17_25385, partial [Planctomycetaceae bacterium]
MKKQWKLMIFAVTTILQMLSQSAQADDVLLIFDSSASMSEHTIDGVPKLDAARTATERILPSLQDDDVALMVFGHSVDANEPGCCEDIELQIPFGSGAIPFCMSAKWLLRGDLRGWCLGFSFGTHGLRLPAPVGKSRIAMP